MGLSTFFWPTLYLYVKIIFFVIFIFRSNENGHRKNGITTYADGDQSHQRLLPPTPMVEQNSIIVGPCSHSYNMQENNRTPSVISKPQSCTSTTDSSRASIENYDPDLIHHYTMHKKTSTPLRWVLTKKF